MSSYPLRLLVSVVLLAMLLSQIEIGRVIRIFEGARLDLLAVVFLLLVGDRFLAGYRWYMLLHGLNPGITYGGVMRLSFVSSFVGFFMPGGIEVVRIYGLSRATSDAALAFSSVLVERVQSVIGLIGLVLAGLVAWPPALPPAIAHSAWLGLLALSVGCAALMHPRTRRLTVQLLPGAWLAPVRNYVGEVYARLDAYSERPALLGWAMVVTLGFQLYRVVTVVVGAWALGIHVSTLYFLILLPIVFFLTLLPISVAGGLGVRETGFVYLLGLVDVSPEAAFTLSLLISLSSILLALPGGWFYARAGVVHR